MITLHKVAAFVAREYAEASSYRLSFVLRYLSALMPCWSSTSSPISFKGGASPHLTRYGGNYFALSPSFQNGCKPSRPWYPSPTLWRRCAMHCSIPRR